MADDKMPDVIVFEGRIYRIDRVAKVEKSTDVRVIRERLPYEKPALRDLGSVADLTGTGTGSVADGLGNLKQHRGP
jgi:hypothetical protein